MSIQDERDLRGRLGGLLDGVEPMAAPVARAMHRGKVIRTRRWVAAAGGVAVIAAGCVVLPRLIIGHQTTAPVAPRHYKVTVQDLGPTARGRLIAAGTINNKRWQILLDNRFGNGCAVNVYVLTCGQQSDSKVGPREVSLSSAGAGGTQFQIGNVGTNVTRVVIRLSNGTELELRPISAGGKRWVAVAAPLHAMLEATSFVGNSEYQHAVPYVSPNDTEFVTWLRPGQPGLARASAHLGSGRVNGAAWSTSVSIGPWGYCVAFANGRSCNPTTSVRVPRIGTPLTPLTCGTLFQGTTAKEAGLAGVVVVPAGVKNVVIKFADGNRMRLVATLVGGKRTIGYGIPNRPRIARVLEYGFAGQLVGSVSGAGWGC